MRKLNPTIKVVTSLIVALILAFQENLSLNLTVAAISFSLILFLLPLKRVLVILGIVTLSAIGVYFTGFHFKEGNSDLLTRQLYGLQLASRIYAFAGLGLVFSASTVLTDFIYSLQQQFCLPNKFAYGILAAFHMLPMIPYEVKNIKNSFYSRGLRPLMFSPQLLLPLLVKSIRWSENLAFAMESKGFGDDPRTQSREFSLRWYDWSYSGLWIMGALGLSLLS